MSNPINLNTPPPYIQGNIPQKDNKEQKTQQQVFQLPPLYIPNSSIQHQMLQNTLPTSSITHTLQQIQHKQVFSGNEVSNALENIHTQFDRAIKLDKQNNSNMTQGARDTLLNKINNKNVSDLIKAMLYFLLGNYANTANETLEFLQKGKNLLLEKEKKIKSFSTFQDYPTLQAYSYYAFASFMSNSNDLNELKKAKDSLQQVQKDKIMPFVQKLITQVETNLQIKLDIVQAIQSIQSKPNISEEHLSQTLKQLDTCFKQALKIEKPLQIKTFLMKKIEEENISNEIKAMLCFLLSFYSNTQEEKDSFFIKGNKLSFYSPMLRAYATYVEAKIQLKNINDPNSLPSIIQSLQKPRENPNNETIKHSLDLLLNLPQICFTDEENI